MRQIQFRAWDGKYKRMHYKVTVGNLSDEENYTAHGVYLKPGDTDYSIEPPGQWMHFTEHSDFTLMQFTGLLDKDGKEVFEGDIVSNGVAIFFIEWSPSVFMYMARGVKRDDKELYTLSDVIQLKYSIIGNIYQNPELLKQ